LQNETDIAVECLRRVVKITPDDPVVLNNLACLLGESVNGCSEGLQHIDRAIALVGDVPDLLDSKGTILMRMGQLEDAASIFEKAAERGQDPRIVLHWYLALKRANKFDAAKLVQQRIDRERLRRVPLNIEEQQELAALK
jgi:tetratricopeptide (TPR) repeat protein